MSQERVERMLRGLSEAPRFAGLSLRGHRERPEALGYGRSLVSTWICATSLDVRVATGNGLTDQVFAIYGDGGADLRTLSAAPEEREITYLPGTMFVYGPTEQVDRWRVTFVEQVDLHRQPDVRARLTHEWAAGTLPAMLAAVPAGPAALRHTEKFIGPLAAT